MQLRGDKPIRHGFQAIGVRHGQHSGHHTGPCAGTRFPHLGISTEGTEWALVRERNFLESTKEALAKLATNPDFTWYPMKYDVRGGREDYSRPVVIKHGDDDISSGLGEPSYATLHRREKTQLENQQDRAERAIAEYKRVLASWSPEKYPTTGAPAKVETTHMEMPRKHVRFGKWKGILCRFTRAGHASDKLAKTDDPKKVTCKRCRTLLGLPPL